MRVLARAPAGGGRWCPCGERRWRGGCGDRDAQRVNKLVDEGREAGTFFAHKAGGSEAVLDQHRQRSVNRQAGVPRKRCPLCCMLMADVWR